MDVQTEVVQPIFEERAGKLVTLYDVLRIHAENFQRAIHMLAIFRGMLETHDNNNGVPIIGTTAPAMVDMLKELSGILGRLDLEGSKYAVDFITQKLDTARPVVNQELRFASQHLYRTMHDELKRVTFFAITRDNAKLYYPKEPLFGAEVDSKFADATDDIAEAGRCLALDRVGGCVYHLMCAMDVALQAFCTSVGITFDPNWDWQVTLDKIEGRINAMPRTTKHELEKKEAQLGAHADLHAVRRAWRNPSMHARLRNLTPERATEIYNAVRAFMRHLAEVI